MKRNPISKLIAGIISILKYCMTAIRRHAKRFSLKKKYLTLDEAVQTKDVNKLTHAFRMSEEGSEIERIAQDKIFKLTGFRYSKKVTTT